MLARRRRTYYISRVLHFKEVTKVYPDTGEALSGVSFGVERGEMVFLTGHSGAGKSTVLRLAALIERPSSGQVLLDGLNLGRLARGRIPYLRRRLGLIFQDSRLLTDLTIQENVALPLCAIGYNERDMTRRVRAALDKVGLSGKERRYPRSLSCGEQQRVGIARAIVHKPPVILADEPTGNLDPALSREIMNLFLEFHQVGVTLLIASHDLGLIAELGCRTLRLEHGRLLELG